MTTRAHWEPFAEPWHATALRTVGLALGIGLGVGLFTRHLATTPLVVLLALWFTLGGHFLEVLFRNRLRARLPVSPAVQVVARLAYWFVGGSVLYVGAALTGALSGIHITRTVPWWVGGFGFLGAELFVHLLLRMRGQPGFYDGRG
jgi:hypothetical protein